MKIYRPPTSSPPGYLGTSWLGSFAPCAAFGRSCPSFVRDRTKREQQKVSVNSPTSPLIAVDCIRPSSSTTVPPLCCIMSSSPNVHNLDEPTSIIAQSSDSNALLTRVETTYTNESVSGLEFERILVVVDQSESSRFSSSEGGSESEDDDGILVGLVLQSIIRNDEYTRSQLVRRRNAMTDHSGQLGPQLVLGDVSPSGVENIHDHLLSLQESVGEELSRSNRDSSGGVLRTSHLVSNRLLCLTSCDPATWGRAASSAVVSNPKIEQRFPLSSPASRTPPISRSLSCSP